MWNKPCSFRCVVFSALCLARLQVWCQHDAHNTTHLKPHGLFHPLFPLPFLLVGATRTINSQFGRLFSYRDITTRRCCRGMQLLLCYAIPRLMRSISHLQQPSFETYFGYQAPSVYVKADTKPHEVYVSNEKHSKIPIEHNDAGYVYRSLVEELPSS